MRKSRFSETQIVEILREQESGATAIDICRRHGISQPTFYKWKAKYGAPADPLRAQASDVSRMQRLEEENRKLKTLLADSMLRNVALKDRLRKD
jgi:putative transposase